MVQFIEGNIHPVADIFHKLVYNSLTLGRKVCTLTHPPKHTSLQPWVRNLKIFVLVEGGVICTAEVDLIKQCLSERIESLTHQHGELLLSIDSLRFKDVMNLLLHWEYILEGHAVWKLSWPSDIFELFVKVLFLMQYSLIDVEVAHWIGKTLLDEAFTAIESRQHSVVSVAKFTLSELHQIFKRELINIFLKLILF